MKKAIVIVAGGKGLRMGGEVPKQFLPVGGMPILMRTIKRFHEYSQDIQIVLVLPKSQQEYWNELCLQYGFDIPHIVADGGETRFHSVKSGIGRVDDDVAFIGVHDGVRPFVSIDVIGRCYDVAATAEAVVPVIDVFETLRHMPADDTISHTVPRNEYRLVQTPQVFDASLLRNAYSQPYTDFFTDDASVVETYGHDVTLVEGNRENIKITTPYDMKIAEVLV